MLGKDCDKNEYWFFKEDPGKIFVKFIEVIKTTTCSNDEDEQMMEEICEVKTSWSFYDEEEQYEKLIEACNVKGTRERKL